MTREEMTQRFGMLPHVEGGLFRELYTQDKQEGARLSSGVIYYALGPGEHADFHALDCDEYWLYHTGSPLEIWIYDEAGRAWVERLGLEEGAQPCVLLKAGWLFGARPVPGAAETTLLSCVTVPQFSYEHYRLLSREEMLALHPDAAAFFN